MTDDNNDPVKGKDKETESDFQDNYYKSVNKDIKETLELMKAEGSSKVNLLNKELELLDSANLGLLNLEDQEKFSIELLF